ncbi:YhcH/YjgK/YiaL family protein [Paenibacillus sp. RC67]|uniref:YhcH/YjgK/YiaL family protein n=1 Tax=Paenibacillus sp. RC67 TaxID=3039392 RepID=UPI0024ACE5B3|nr:YhcH/YjgK/YiaL family protein [Paenibacillus sp. RC67]
MLVGSLEQEESQRCGMHPALSKVIDFLQNTDFRQLENGKYTIDSDRLYVNVMELTTKSKEDAAAEKHRRYIDIHYLLKGEERIGWSFHDEEMIPSQAFNEEQDYALYQGVADEHFVNLTPGMYVILYPNEIHRPGLCQGAPASIRKAVVKIDIELLKIQEAGPFLL